jgi:uncharacterized membrane protein YfcA
VISPPQKKNGSGHGRGSICRDPRCRAPLSAAKKRRDYAAIPAVYGVRVTTNDESTTETVTLSPVALLRRSLLAAFTAGAVVGMLGGMIGLGDAEFRLPLLIGVFGFVALQAVILNKAMSLAVVLTALPTRLAVVPYSELAPHYLVVVNLLAGSLVGAWAGASWTTRMRTAILRKVPAALLVLMPARRSGPCRSIHP